MSPSITIEFDPALRSGEAYFTELTINEPNIGQLLQATKFGGGDGPKMMLYLIAECAGTTTKVIEQMPMSQFGKAVGFLAPLLDVVPNSDSESSS